ncbi:LptF/LptG family permease [Sunxiuqinia elliptica]|uniref:Lipopolysaccharide export system permease protein n=1 Tax=Sunxiuqinia elliptica TaxID=655355 RepID=A0A1I2JL51_9BACT|nr:LptF/LptG family permease [Sunxiuqinia elliptica]SFF55294.1 lipopolysaccharide export system permease protein [Sunxiuqinia elliptica]
MKRLHLFVLRTFLGPFFMTFFICVFVLLMQFLWKYIDDMVGKGLEWGIVAELLLYASFALIPMAFPLAMLLASIMTFGNLGENYELVAIKASGISLFKIMRPLIVVALALTMFAFYFSNNILPKTNLKFGALLVSVKQQKPEMVISEGVFTNEIDGYSIKVDRKASKGNMMYGLMIYNHTKNSGNANVTVADSGFMKISEDKKYMIMTLFNGQSATNTKPNQRGKKRTFPFRRERFSKQTITIPLEGFDFQRTDENRLRNAYKMMNLTQLEHREDSMYSDYHVRVRRFAASMNYPNPLTQMVLNQTQTVDSLKKETHFTPDTLVKFDEVYHTLDDHIQNEVINMAIGQARTNHQTINQNLHELYNQKKSINKLTMEKHKKFTWSIACFIFFFIGAPLGAIIRKGGLGMPVVVSILMFITYYMVSITGEKFAREDMWVMANGMWFSTYIFLPLGIFLTYKSANDSALLNLETYQLKLKRLFGFLFKSKDKKDKS